MTSKEIESQDKLTDVLRQLQPKEMEVSRLRASLEASQSQVKSLEEEAKVATEKAHAQRKAALDSEYEWRSQLDKMSSELASVAAQLKQESARADRLSADVERRAEEIRVLKSEGAVTKEQLVLENSKLKNLVVIYKSAKADAEAELQQKLSLLSSLRASGLEVERLREEEKREEGRDGPPPRRPRNR